MRKKLLKYEIIESNYNAFLDKKYENQCLRTVQMQFRKAEVLTRKNKQNKITILRGNQEFIYRHFEGIIKLLSI